MKKYIAIALLAGASLFSQAQAATVTCTFMSETKINTKGEWISTSMDFMRLMRIFGDGLRLNLDNSLLGKLNQKEPFLAGEVSRGKVYLMGGDMGVEGKLTNVVGDEITIYDGICQVGFGG